MKFLVFIRGVVFGALAGSIAGLLLAPESGEILQARLRARYAEAMEEGRRAAVERRAELEAQFSAAKHPARPTT
jgi:gas vesicle protein